MRNLEVCKWRSSLLIALLESHVSLFDEAKLDASGREERDDGLLAFADDEDVAGSGGE